MLYSIRHLSMTRRAWAVVRNQCSLRHSSRNRPLKLSMYAFSIGLPGRMKLSAVCGHRRAFGDIPDEGSGIRVRITRQLSCRVDFTESQGEPCDDTDQHERCNDHCVLDEPIHRFLLLPCAPLLKRYRRVAMDDVGQILIGAKVRPT